MKCPLDCSYTEEANFFFYPPKRSRCSSGFCGKVSCILVIIAYIIPQLSLYCVAHCRHIPRIIYRMPSAFYHCAMDGGNMFHSSIKDKFHLWPLNKLLRANENLHRADDTLRSRYQAHLLGIFESSLTNSAPIALRPILRTLCK